MNIKKIILIALNAVCLMTIFTPKCYAYLDPATTSYVIQIVAGIVIACGAAVGIFWNKITRKFRKKKDNENDMPSNKASETDNSEGKVITADDLLDDE